MGLPHSESWSRQLYLGADDAVDRSRGNVCPLFVFFDVSAVAVPVAADPLLDDHLRCAVQVGLTHGLQVAHEHTAAATATAAAVAARPLDPVHHEGGHAVLVASVPSVTGELGRAVGVDAVALVVLPQLVVRDHYFQRVHRVAANRDLQ